MLLKAAIAGCGKIGWSFQDDPGAARFGVCTHAAAWSKVAGVDLVAVTDKDSVNARQCAERWQVPGIYDDLDSLLAGAAPDIVSIATPDHLHYSGVKACLEHPAVRAVLAEKPLAASAAEAAELDALATRLGKVLVVNYSRRFCGFYVALRQRIKAGEFGELKLARNLYTKGARHNGSHFVDLMQSLFGPLQPLSATLPSWLERDARNVDPGLDIHLVTAGGATVVMNHLPADQYTVFELDLCFDSARFIFTDGGDTVQEFGMVKDLPFAGYTSLALKAVHQNAMRDYLLRAAEHVVDIIDKGVPNLSPAADSVTMLTRYESLPHLIS